LSEGRWTTFFEPLEWLANFSADAAGFLRAFARQGDAFVDFIGYGQDDGADRFRFSALAVFNPIFPTYRQAVRWFEATQERHNPFLQRHGFWGFDGIGRMQHLAERAGLSAADLGPADLLLGLALPCAGPALTVVAPPTFAISPAVARQAAKRGTALHRLPLTEFPPEEIERIRRNDTCAARLDARSGETVYPRDFLRRMGEPIDLYRDRVPPCWRHFGLDR